MFQLNHSQESRVGKSDVGTNARQIKEYLRRVACVVAS